MSLETRISEMSDSGQFEKLATEVLRWSNQEYRSVIQTGINTEGKPIRDPVDGLGHVPDADPPHFVLLEFTTTQASGLERKWLANPDPRSDKPKGDLIKAVKQAEDIREDISRADFTVVLVSNRVLDSELVRAVYGTANTFDISVDVWDVHRLRDFLQTNPDGQYIRKEHFGIDEERLSEQLLLELSSNSLHSYQECFHIPVNQAKIERPELSTLLRISRRSDMGSYFIPVVGNSGFGKTVVCYQAMEQWNADEKPAVRLDPEDIESAKTLAQAIQSGLTRLHPSLESTAGQTALQLAEETSQLLIVVDDLNRADNPSQLLSQLQNWMGGAREKATDVPGDKKSTASNELPVAILCPLWPRIWARQKRNMNQNEFSEIIELGPLSVERAGNLIQLHADMHGHDFGDEEARELAERVGRDPHLIGLIGQLMHGKDTIDDLPDTSKEVLNEYSEYAYETASEASDEPLIVPDYEQAVEKLSLDVMEARNTAPAWREVCEWSRSSSQNLDEIRILSEQEQILTILKQRAERILSFRHDRIRDFLLANASFNKISRTNVVPSCLSDPYYYSILGTGITYFRPSETTLSELCDRNSLALLEALRKIDGNSPEYEKIIGRKFKQWLDKQGGHPEISNSLLGEAMDILQETNSDQVPEIAKSLPQFPPVLLCRFRNGELEAGIQYCKGNRGGSPDLTNPQRDLIFDDAIQQGGDQYVDELSEILSVVDAEDARGTLRLAGFFGRTELASGIKDCWKKHGHNLNLLPAFLWASFQCGIPGHRSLVDQVISRWESLPSGNSIDDENIELGTGDVFREVQHSIGQDISENQMKYLIKAADKFSSVEHYLVSILSEISDPDALELVVKKRGEHMREIDGMSPWAMTLLDQWSPSRLRGQALPSKSKGRMKEIWTDTENIDEIRTSAFQLWARNAEEENIEELKRASENDLFEYAAHYQRLKLGDKTAITSPPLDFAENDGLLDVLPNTWGPEAYELVDDLLNRHSPEHSENLFYHLGSLLFRIPRDNAEQLMNTHWEKVGTHPKFFQAALYTATSLTKELAEEAYGKSDNKERLLEHLGSDFGFNISGRSQLISERHLNFLEPYLDDISDIDLTRIGEKAYELGMEDWATNHVQPQLPDDWRQKHNPTDQDLIEQLNEIRDSEKKNIRGWMMRFGERSASKSHVFRVLEEWLQTDPTLDAYRISVEIIKNWGTRKELEILDDVSVKDDNIQRLYEDAKFGVKVRTLN